MTLFPGPETLAMMIPILALSIPIVAILAGVFTKHQQRMAEIMHASHAQSQQGDIQGLRRDIADLKEIVATQAITLDNLAQVQQKMLMSSTATPPTEPLADRLRQTQ